MPAVAIAQSAETLLIHPSTAESLRYAQYALENGNIVDVNREDDGLIKLAVSTSQQKLPNCCNPNTAKFQQFPERIEYFSFDGDRCVRNTAIELQGAVDGKAMYMKGETDCWEIKRAAATLQATLRGRYISGVKGVEQFAV